MANSPKRTAQSLTTVGSPNAGPKGQQVQYQETVPGTVQGPPAQGAPVGPYGQPPMGTGFETWGWNPRVRDLMIACGIAAAIAIPIAVANSGSGTGS